MKTNRSLYLFFILLTFLSQFAFAQKDTAFWFAPPQICKAQGVFSQSNLDTPIYLRISAYGQASTVTIYQPANPAFTPIVRTIRANSTVTVTLTYLITLLETTPVDQVLNTGLKVSATAPISVYYDAECILSPEIFALKGQNALGTSFWIPGQNVVGNAYYPPQPYNSFDIVATEDNTVVTITPSQPVTGHAAGVAYTETLNHGQTYSAGATSSSPSNHLHGSTVTSTKPIAITVKDDLLDAASIWGNGQDLTGDQIIPVNVIGTEYIPVRGDLYSPYDKIFILATQNGTTINQDGVYLTTINAGATYGIFMANPSTYIQTNNPVYVWQLSGQGGELGSGILPPITCTGSDQVAYVRGTSDPLDIMLLVQNGGQNNFQFNGNTSVILPGSFAAVPGTGGQWVTAKFSITTAQLPKDSPLLITNSTNLFHMGVDNGTLGQGGNFGYFSNFNSFSVTASNMVAPCNSSISFHADSIAGAVYSWTGPNGFVSSSVNPVRPNPTLADTGDYTLSVTYNNCSGVSITNVQLATIGSNIFSLGPDTTYCSAFSRVLSSGMTGTRWSNGDTGTQITVTAPGLYWAQDSNICGTFRDTIIISQSAAPAPINIGNDTNYCSNFSRILTTGVAATKWSTGVTGPSITVTTAGIYWAMDSNQCGKVRDTIVLTQGAPPAFSLGNDTAYCSNFSRTLTTGVANVSTRWNTGATTPSITVTAAGLYWAQDSNLCGVRRDTILLTQNAPPVVHLGNDTTLCNGSTLALHDTSTNATFLWNTNAVTSSINVTTAGSYWLQVTQNGCKSRDTIVATFLSPPPAFNLGNDTAYCSNFTRTLSTGLVGVTTRWNTGATTPSITVNAAGLYWAQDSNMCGTKRDSITLTQYAPPIVHLDNDTTLCNGNTLALNDTSTNATFLWNTNAVTSSINVTTAGSYWLQVTQNGCKSRDTIVATFLSPPPAFNLGNDTAYCGNFTRSLSTGLVGVTTRWNTSATTPSITVNAAGLYWVQDSNMCGTKRDSITLTQYAPPIVHLGNDTTLCNGNTLILNDTSTNATFLWNTNAVTSSINVITSGSYWLQVTQNGCKSRDTIVATFLSPPAAFNLGNDTTYCGAFSRTLSTGIAGVSTRWNTGATTTSITVSAPGQYWAQDSNLCGTNRDSIILTENIPPLVALGNDTTLCNGATLVLTDTTTNATFLWSNNATTSSITLTTSGSYWLQVTQNNCPSRDTLVATFLNPPSTFNLGGDTTYCGSFSRVLSTGLTNVSTRWNTGATAASILVTSAGLYWAQDSNLCGTFRDSIQLYQNPVPVVNLGDDTTVCLDQTVILNAGNAGASFLWQDNSTNQIYTVTNAGLYRVRVTSSGCSASDSVLVSFEAPPALFSLGGDTTICEDSIIILNAYEPNVNYYIWNTHDTTSYISVNQAGTYYVTDSNACGSAKASKTIFTKQCICRLAIPTAFSPNDDGKNDNFGVVYQCPITVFSMAIYNRWGQRIYQTYNIMDRWDGNYRGEAQPLGVYVFLISYVDPYTNLEKSVSGNVTLIR